MYNAIGCGTPYGYGYGGYAPLARRQNASPTIGASLDSMTSSVKEFLDKESIQGVPNKYLVGGALALGLGIMAYNRHWL